MERPNGSRDDKILADEQSEQSYLHIKCKRRIFRFRDKAIAENTSIPEIKDREIRTISILTKRYRKSIKDRAFIKFTIN